MKKRYQDGGPIDEMEEANNRPQIVSRKRPMMPMPSPNDESGTMQNLISAGSDFKGRPQDEGYRPNEGTAMERAMAEGARDSGKITESGDQGFGGAGSSRTVKAMPKQMPKPSPMAAPKPAAKAEATPAPKPAADKTTMSVTERAKATRERARSGSDSTDSRSVNERLKDSGIGSSISNYFKNFKTPAQRKAQEQKAAKGYASGGKVSASSRGDGIAQRGKTRGKMC